MGPPQDVNLLALLAPLALLASQGVLTLRRGAAAALDWFGVITFAFFVGLIWLGYMGMMTGVPPRVAANFVRAAPGFTPQFNLLCFLFAAALTLAWLYIVLFAVPAPLRSVARWAAGVVLLWERSRCCGCPGPTTRRATARWRSSCAPRSRWAPAASRRSSSA